MSISRLVCSRIRLLRISMCRCRFTLSDAGLEMIISLITLKSSPQLQVFSSLLKSRT